MRMLNGDDWAFATIPGDEDQFEVSRALDETGARIWERARYPAPSRQGLRLLARREWRFSSNGHPPGDFCVVGRYANVSGPMIMHFDRCDLPPLGAGQDLT
jgi:hypothetical protein